MNNRTTTQVLAVSAAVISSLCIYSNKADAQFNGSNSSGSNTTSYSGSSNSIWNSNRKEAPVQKLIPPVSVTIKYIDRPVEVIKYVDRPIKVIEYVETVKYEYCPNRYPKAVKGSVRGRG